MGFTMNGQLSKYFLPQEFFNDGEETLFSIPEPIKGKRVVYVTTGSICMPSLKFTLPTIIESAKDTYTKALQLTQQPLLQIYENECCVFRVKREKHFVKIEWEFKKNADGDYIQSLIGIAAEIDFVPDPKNHICGPIVKTTKDGDIHMELSEGRCYLFTFRAGRHHIIKGREEDDRLMDIYNYYLLSFTVGIPLSGSQKSNLQQYEQLLDSKDEQMRHAFLSRRHKIELFDNLFNEEIEKIKSKGLPEREEAKKIAELKADIFQLKEKYIPPS